jgi:hypothetical protein
VGLGGLRQRRGTRLGEGVLLRRSLAEPHVLAFHFTHPAAGAAFADLAQVAGTRWAIEVCFAPRVGLDQYEWAVRALIS